MRWEEIKPKDLYFRGAGMYMLGKMLDRKEGARGLANFSIATYTIFSVIQTNIKSQC